MSDAAAPTGEGSGGGSASSRTPARPKPWWWSKPARNALKIVAIFFVFYFFILPLIPGFGKAVHDLQQVNPALLLLGLLLEMGSLVCYSLLTRAALPRGHVSFGRMVRIQFATRAVASVVPGGQRGRLGPRLPAADAVGRRRPRRRLRARHRRASARRWC